MRTILSFCEGLPEKAFAAGEVLLTEGGRDGRLLILVEGEVAIAKGGIQVNVASEPGAILGELSVLLDIPHTATVTALAPARVRVADDGVRFLQQHQDVAYQLARLLAQRLHGITGYLVDIKRQFQGSDHLAMVDEVLGSLLHQPAEDSQPGSERDPNTAI
jgi:CRP/FNR family transcriptional regulator, cyclic AMP receptor protein